MTGFRHILVPVDGSAGSDKALADAIRLAGFNGAKITLLHVMDQVDVVDPRKSDAGHASPAIEQARAFLRTEAENLLARLGERVLMRGLPLECVLTAGAGRVADVVAEQAQIGHADLIVLGSHGRRCLGRVLLGSHAEQIIRCAPAPVLVVRGGVGSSAGN